MMGESVREKKLLGRRSTRTGTRTQDQLVKSQLLYQLSYPRILLKAPVGAAATLHEVGGVWQVKSCKKMIFFEKRGKMGGERGCVGLVSVAIFAFASEPDGEEARAFGVRGRRD